MRSIFNSVIAALVLLNTCNPHPMNIYSRQQQQRPYQNQFNQNNDPNVDAAQNSYNYDQFSQKFDRNAVASNYNTSAETPPPSNNQVQSNPSTVLSVQPPPLAPIENPQQVKDDSAKSSQLKRMVQELYLAQGQVQVEATEIKRAQTIATSAQQNLEDAANNVRVITTALRSAQESVANAALRAQTAQLQLAAHDQLLFTARQKVDALSAQMVGLQAEVGITAGSGNTIDLAALLNRLRQPLPPQDQPQPIPTTSNDSPNTIGGGGGGGESHPLIIHSADSSMSNSNSNLPRIDIQSPSSDTQGLVVDRSRRSGLQDTDLQNLLSWVRHENDGELLKATSGDFDAFDANREQDYSARYVRDFVTNMQNLYGQRSDGGYDEDATDKFNDDSIDRRRRNAKYIQNSIKAVNNRQRKRHINNGKQ